MPQTPSQTVGPFFHLALAPDAPGVTPIAGNVLAGPQTRGERITVEGRVLDGAGVPVDDALIELWQANAAGRYAHPDDDRDAVALDPAFSGFGRAATGADGSFRFETVKPGRVPGRGNTLQAPHLNLVVLARGLLSHLFTRLYFADEAEANDEDPVLAAVDPSRRHTLLAARDGTAQPPVYRLDIRLQGPDETVFFDA